MRVLIIDDDPFVCSSLATILKVQDDTEVVGTGNSGTDAMRLYTQHQPDILLMDIQMGETNGLDAARAILADTPAARIVFLTTFADDDYIVAALRMGAKGYLIKQDVAKIVPALHSVMAGQSVLGGEVLDRLDVLMQTNTATEQATTEQNKQHSALESLSERENALIELIADGLDNKEIAARLYISEGTVRNHISTMLAKLNLKNRTQLAILYYRSI